MYSGDNIFHCFSTARPICLFESPANMHNSTKKGQVLNPKALKMDACIASDSDLNGVWCAKSTLTSLLISPMKCKRYGKERRRRWTCMKEGESYFQVMKLSLEFQLVFLFFLFDAPFRYHASTTSPNLCLYFAPGPDMAHSVGCLFLYGIPFSKDL